MISAVARRRFSYFEIVRIDSRPGYRPELESVRGRVGACPRMVDPGTRRLAARVSSTLMTSTRALRCGSLNGEPEHDEVDAPVPPILSRKGQDLMFFRSQQTLASELEPWFPQNVHYKAWDGVGRRLELVVVDAGEPRRRRWRSQRGTVVALLAADQLDAENAAPDYVRGWLRQVGAPAPWRGASLAELLMQGHTRGDPR